jgi:hypothetical protein
MGNLKRLLQAVGWSVVMGTIIGLALSLVVAITPANATTIPACDSIGTGTQCNLITREQATGQGSGRIYNIYTENGGYYSDVLRLYKSGAAFVPRFTVVSASSGSWIYPNIGQGAEHGMRPPNSWAPVQIGYNGRNAGNIWLNTHTYLTRSGSWNAAWDIWFEPRYDYYGVNQSVGGTEIMIWNAAMRGGRWITNGPGYYYGTVWLDGNWWNVNASVVSQNGHSWKRIYFVATRPGSYFNGSFNPFMAKAGHLGYLSASEYLSGLDYGFEINSGGAGLAVNSMYVTGVR